MFTVTVLDYDDLPQDLKDKSCKAEEPFLLVEHAGKVIAFEGSFEEGEDIDFRYRLEWVPKLLVSAYHLGKIDAITGAIETFRDKTIGS